MSSDFCKKGGKQLKEGETPSPGGSEQRIQLKRELVGLAYQDQVDRLKPPMPVQMFSTQDGPSQDDVATAAVKQKGSGAPLSEPVQKAAESHLGADFSGVRVHNDSHAQAASAGLGARAFTHGQDIFLGARESASNVQLMGHELTHVVQQGAVGNKAIQHKLKVSPSNDRAEVEAAQMAEAIATDGGKTSGLIVDEGTQAQDGAVVQRYAFADGKQVTKDKQGLAGPMLEMVKDDVVRIYDSIDEFNQHSSKSTDYLGNLNDGTWVRFSPAGINLLGENHTLVTLEQVAPAVGSTNFIYEPFSMDDMPDDSKMREVYEDENAERFKKMGIADQLDKTKFGAESLFPKMGFGLTLALPYFKGDEPISELKEEDGYVGQPIQRYLKIAWGHSKDNKAQVEALKSARLRVPDKMGKLAAVHTVVEGSLDPFITGLAVDGYLGDALDTPANLLLLPLLAMFAMALTDAMVELAASDPSSRLNLFTRTMLTQADSTSDAFKLELFGKWRNFKFEDAVADATNRGVRYAGMGQAHLYYLMEKGLISGQHPYMMADVHLAFFKSITAAYSSMADPQ